MKGTIKFFNQSRGFGFITSPEQSGDVFIHISACDGKTPRDGQAVEFDLGVDRKNKTCAQNVRSV